MKFFTVEEIFYSIFFSFALGILCGCIFSASDVIFTSLNKVIISPLGVYRKIGCFSKKSVEELILYKPKTKATNLTKNILEAILFSFFGIGMLILVYSTLDGVFRLYVLITVALAFVLAKKTLGKLFCKTFERVFRYLYKALIYVEYFILYPVNFVFKFLKAKFIKAWRPIKAKITERRVQALINKKISEIKKYNFNKIQTQG